MTGRSGREPASSSSWLLEPDGAGAELFRTRPVPGPLAWVVLVVVSALGGCLTLLAPERSPLLFAVGAGLIALLFLALYGAGYSERYRVCENALVVGSTAGGQPYVIPWVSVRPESLTVHDPANRFRAPAGETGDRATRMAIYSTRAVSIEGLLADLAHPRLRERSTIAKRLLAGRTVEQLERQPPLSRWVMGVTDPGPLAHAIEKALIANGFPAQGQADRALGHPVAGRGDAPAPAAPDAS